LTHFGGCFEKVLDLSNNWIGNLKQDGIFRLAEAIRHTKTLTTLSIAENRLTGESLTNMEGIIEIAEAVQNSTVLTSLNLSNNFIGFKSQDGVKKIAEMLRNSVSLRELDISSNKLMGGNYDRFEGASKLANSLRYNTSLRKLDLSFNDIGTQNKKQVIADFEVGLSVNNGIRVLDMRGNPMSEALLPHIARRGHMGEDGGACLLFSLSASLLPLPLQQLGSLLASCCYCVDSVILLVFFSAMPAGVIAIGIFLFLLLLLATMSMLLLSFEQIIRGGWGGAQYLLPHSPIMVLYYDNRC
jgi:Leucine-rich repeat (LRR) protein